MPPTPDYAAVCAPVGADVSATCLRVTLQAIDTARAAEGIPPMVLPSDFARLTVAQQLFVALNRERVDRGLAPFAGLTTSLDQLAEQGASVGQLPPEPGRSYTSVATEWIGAVGNGLGADYQWMYQDGPKSGVPGCSGAQRLGCWADRDIVLGPLGSRRLVMGAAFDPSADTSPGDRGGSSLAAVLAVGPQLSGDAYAYTWEQAMADTAVGTLRPLRAVPAGESLTGIPDPHRNIGPQPDFTTVCTGGRIDDSPACVAAALSAINHAHALEGVPPMVLPRGFSQLSVPEQLFVAVNLERVDRGLAPFGGLTAALDANAQRGADTANDPPAAGGRYLLDDSEWAGGSANGLDAVYGWMYDDGYNSGNLDCPHRTSPGCWGHRKGILDDFGSGPNLVMGAALDPRGDTNRGDKGGTSMAVTLAVADAPAGPDTYAYGWAQALAAVPPGAIP